MKAMTFFINLMRRRVKNTIYIFGEGIDFFTKAVNAEEERVSERKETIEHLVDLKRGQNVRDQELNKRIKSEREGLQRYRKNLSMLKCRVRLSSSMKKKLVEADDV